LHVDPRRAAHEDPLCRLMLEQRERALWVFAEECTQGTQVCSIGC
jgi:hypothetical protein